MPLSPGDHIGPYEILAPLGAGGMGEVYRAGDPRLGRDVAIKVLPGHLSNDPQALARLEREAKTLAALSHPNILAIYDTGLDQGVAYAVTELLEGETLRSVLGRRALPWRKAAEIGAAIAEGLSAAHARGIIHRDLKPENIFLTPDGRVKILDFGLARWVPSGLPERADAAATQTEPGTLMGTVGYVSPEQVQGKTVEATSDIFSLGCVIYEMLTGQQAFAGPSTAETLAAILKDEPRLSGAARQVPAELVYLIAHCLEKNPGKRLQSARDLSLALRDAGSRHAKEVPAGARRAWITAAVALIVLSLGLYLRFVRSGPIDSLAVLPFVNASANADAEFLSDGITESIISNLSKLHSLRVVPRSTVFHFRGRDLDPQKIGHELNVRAVLIGRVIERSGTLIVTTELVDIAGASQIWGEQYNRKLSDVLALQEEISREISNKLRLRLSGEDEKRLIRRYTDNTEAYQLYLKGRYYWNKRTIEAYKRATEHFAQAIEKDPGYAPAYAGLADCYNVAGWYGMLSPKESFGRARAAAARALAIDDALAEAHAALAFPKQFLEWDWAGAEIELKRAIELNPDYPTAHQWYGIHYRLQGRLVEAMAETKRALALDPLSSPINTTVGLELYLSRRYDEAIEQLRKALEMDPSYPTAHLQLGMLYEQKAMYEPAIAELQKAVALFGGEPTARAALGHAYAVSGDKDAARKVLDELKGLSGQRYVSAYMVALIYTGLGEREQAWAWLQRAYEERSSWLTDRVKSDPMLDSLRPDARFFDLLHRMNLPP